MPKEVILNWEEYLQLSAAAKNYYEIFNSASAAVQLNKHHLITEQNAKAYLMPILRVLERSITNAD